MSAKLTPEQHALRIIKIRERKRVWAAEKQKSDPEALRAYRRERNARYPEMKAASAARYRKAHREKVLRANREGDWAMLKNLGVPPEMKDQVPPELIEAKRLQLKLKRKLKELSK